MTHSVKTSEKTLDDERGRMTVYVRCGYHQSLPVMEGENTVPQVGPGNIESRGKEKKPRKSEPPKRSQGMPGTRGTTDDQSPNAQPV